MILRQKLKKLKKSIISLYLLSSLLFLTGNILLTFNISLLVGIETFYRIIGITILFLIFIFYILYGFVWLFNNKKIKLISFSLIIILISFLCLFGSYYINKTYRLIDNIAKDEVTYTTYLLKNKTDKLNATSKLGMIIDENDITGNIMAKELIKKEKLTTMELTYYDEYQEMFNALLKNEINGFFIDNSYDSRFRDNELYSEFIEKIEIAYKYNKNVPKKSNVSKINLTKPFTVLLLGGESLQNDLADSIILVTFNPKTLTSTILSLPRDSYVPIACKKNKENKINTATTQNVECMIDTITNLTGIKIDYYFKINFTGIVDLVDALGGVNVNVPYSFCEQNSKRQWGENTIYVKKGNQVLNGEEALAFSRNRHTWAHCPKEYSSYNAPLDFGRSQNQQTVIQAILDKFKNTRNIDDFYKTLNVISKNLDSNMPTEQILSLYDVGKRMLTSGINIERLYVETYNIYVNASSMEQIHTKSLNAVIAAMNNNLEKNSPVLIKTFNFDANIPYEQTMIGKGLVDSVRRETVPKFSSLSDAEIWGNNKQIKITNIELNEIDFHKKCGKDVIICSNPIDKTLVSTISELNIYTIKKDQLTQDE